MPNKLWQVFVGHCEETFKVDFYSNIGNDSLKAVGQYCLNMKIVVLKNCPLIEDHGIAVLFYLAGSVLIEVWLQGLCISDLSLGILFKCFTKLETLSFVSCIGVEDYPLTLVAPCCHSLVSLSIGNCPGVGNTTIDVVGGRCCKLTYIDLNGLLRVTNEGLIPLVKNCAANLVEVNLGGCVNIMDISVLVIVKLNRGSLKSLLVDGCRHVVDATLVKILNSCWMLNVLDVSKCGIIVLGIKTLTSAIQLHLQTLSLFDCTFVSDNFLPFLLN
ncbi:hypothetical protein RDI58_014865 [Solanum bulbocastanum]|uniref:Uncharacterized protein n=1 Tax=Solanum bulbocastanum TaxID=147425 RepID=A0AAN8YAZ4_SOLBU